MREHPTLFGMPMVRATPEGRKTQTSCAAHRAGRASRPSSARTARHYLDAYGWPVVTRAAVEGVKDSEQDPKPWKSNKAID